MDLIEYYNKGSVKKTSNKKRFTEEFGTEEVTNILYLLYRLFYIII